VSAQKVVVTDTAVGDDSLERELAEREGAEYHHWDGSSDLAGLLDGADVVFTNFVPLGPHELSRLPEGAVLIRYGIGVDNIDLAAAADAGLRVCNVPDYGANVVADHATMLTLMLVRRVVAFDSAMHRGETPRAAGIGTIDSLESRVVGLVGAGRIAQLTASRLQSLGCTVLASDPYADADALREKDIELVTARGGLVDHEALGRALETGRLGGAALDVTEPEPLPADHPLRSRTDVILTPHTAFYSTESMARLQSLAVDEGHRALRGEDLRAPVPLPDRGTTR
jgi:D-3-phosphoglycerate dehydrogenase